MGDDLWQLASCVAVVAASMLDQISSSVTDTKACGTGWLSVAAVQSLSRVRLFATPWTAARQASLSFTISGNLLRLMSIELMMPPNHLIL